MTTNWPIAELDPLRRLEVMATLTGMTMVDRVLPTAYERVWPVAADLERSMPVLITDIKQARLRTTPTGRSELWVRTHLGPRARFDVALDEGWCWCQSRLWVCGLAAVSTAEGTRFGFLAGPRSRLLRGLGPVLGPVTERLAHRAVRRLEAAVREA